MHPWRRLTCPLRPVQSPPTLWTVNGCGLTAYGARDHDPETGTYVKTQCLSVFFVPVLALPQEAFVPPGRAWKKCQMNGRPPGTLATRPARWCR